MPFKDRSMTDQRAEFVALAQQRGANRRALCRAFQIAPTTGYKWLQRYAAEGAAGLPDRSRRPRRSPAQTAPARRGRCSGPSIRTPAGCCSWTAGPAGPAASGAAWPCPPVAIASAPGPIPPPYGPDDQVRKVRAGGWVSCPGRQLRLQGPARPARGLPPTPTDGCWPSAFPTDDLGTLDLRESA